MFTSCKKDNNGDPTSALINNTLSPDFSKMTPDCYTSDPSNPLITSGDFSADLGIGTTQWNDPHVIKVGAEYWMYASADDNFDHDIKIYRLVSTDGVNWAPNPSTAVLEKSAGKFDARSTETPAVVYFSGKYHMFWTGYTDENDTKTWKIGHATSLDGITFTKDAAALLGPTDPNGAVNLDFNQYLVAEPAPVVFNNKIYLYFTAVGGNIGVGTTLQVIGLTTSADGVSWSAPVSALEPSQAQYPRGNPDYYKGFSTPNAIFMNGEIHVYIDVVVTDAGGSLFSQQKLHHARSSDGLTLWVHDSSEIFDRGDSAWTSTEIRSPSLYLEGSNLLLWYAGHSGITLGIGVATCDL